LNEADAFRVFVIDCLYLLFVKETIWRMNLCMIIIDKLKILMLLNKYSNSHKLCNKMYTIALFPHPRYKNWCNKMCVFSQSFSTKYTEPYIALWFWDSDTKKCGVKSIKYTFIQRIIYTRQKYTNTLAKSTGRAFIAKDIQTNSYKVFSTVLLWPFYINIESTYLLLKLFSNCDTVPNNWEL